MDNLKETTGKTLYQNIPFETADYDFSKLQDNEDYIVEVSDGFMAIPMELKWCTYGDPQWRSLYFNIGNQTITSYVITKNRIAVHRGAIPTNATFNIYKKKIIY